VLLVLDEMPEICAESTFVWTNPESLAKDLAARKTRTTLLLKPGHAGLAHETPPSARQTSGRGQKANRHASNGAFNQDFNSKDFMA
jgi:hypothetical protein